MVCLSALPWEQRVFLTWPGLLAAVECQCRSEGQQQEQLELALDWERVEEQAVVVRCHT